MEIQPLDMMLVSCWYIAGVPEGKVCWRVMEQSLNKPFGLKPWKWFCGIWLQTIESGDIGWPKAEAEAEAEA